MDFAQHTTRLGQLQRGRGAGFLSAMQGGEAHREVLDCILHHPHFQDFSRYYAELIMRLEIGIEPLIEAAQEDRESDSLTVLAELVVRNYSEATRLLHRQGEFRAVLLHEIASRDWDEWLADAAPEEALVDYASWLEKNEDDRWKLEEPLFDRIYGPRVHVEPVLDRPFVEPDWSVRRLLSEWLNLKKESFAILQARDGDPLRHELAEIVRREPRLAQAAAFCLGRLGDTRLLSLAEECFVNQDRRGAAICYPYVRELPAVISLPLARSWHGRGGFFRTAARSVLEEHAEDCDREWLENVVEQDSGSGWEIIREVAALARIGDARSVPVLASVSERATYAWARTRALEGLARMDNGHPFLREALWDADDWCVESGCRFGTLDPMAVERLREISADRFREDNVRHQARERIRNA